jgi:hypothetical protein
MRVWGSNGGVGEDVSKHRCDLQGKRRRSHRRAWRDGLSDQTVVRNFEDVRAYRAFERALIVSVDPRSVIELELVHRLASLMWRLRRASAIETGLFEIQGECPLALRHDPPAELLSRGQFNLPLGPMVTAKSPPRADHTIRRSTSENRYQPPRSGRSDEGRGPAASPNVSCTFPILTRPCLTAWAVTKRDCGAKQRKQYGLLTL